MFIKHLGTLYIPRKFDNHRCQWFWSIITIKNNQFIYHLSSRIHICAVAKFDATYVNRSFKRLFIAIFIIFGKTLSKVGERILVDACNALSTWMWIINDCYSDVVRVNHRPKHAISLIWAVSCKIIAINLPHIWFEVKLFIVVKIYISISKS